MSLEGKVAVVTGAGSGMGRQIAASLAEAGCLTVFTDRNAETASDAASRAGAKAQALTLDVRDAGAVALGLETVRRQHGGVDILVNAAGVFEPAGLLGATPDVSRAVFEVNLFGLTEMMRVAARMMIEDERKGRIINIASIVGRQGQRFGLPYAASKAAVISVTQSAALELAPHGITVNAIAPGYVRTAMWDEIRQRLGNNAPEFDDQVASRVPMGRMATPMDMVGMALFLAGPASAYVTGQVINIDGGVFPC